MDVDHVLYFGASDFALTILQWKINRTVDEEGMNVKTG
jgi:hypothetical protein